MRFGRVFNNFTKYSPTMEESISKGMRLYIYWYIEPKKRRRSSKRERIEFLEVILLYFMKIERSRETTSENS